MIAHPLCDLRISISRSADIVAVALTRHEAVGVDIESRRCLLDLDVMTSHGLSTREAEHVLGSSTASRQRDVMLRCWTRKEAVLKAMGIGVAIDLRDVEVHPWLDGRARVRVDCDGLPSSWIVEDVDVGPSLCAAVAHAHPAACTMTVRWISW